MKTLHQCLTLIALLLMFMGATPSDDIVPTLIGNLEKYNAAFAQEKIWVNTDKPYYALGDDIWFKVQVADANIHTPTALSRIVYVELLQPDTKLHRRLMLNLDTVTGTAVADFSLPDSLPAGTYRLRAYTNWMQNFGEEAAFDRPMEVFDPKAASSGAAKTTYTPEAKLQFFPEGGEMIAGFRCRVGFKLTDQFGKGINGSGLVVSNEGVTVARFQAACAGIGAFRFVPEVGKGYTAKLYRPDSTFTEFALPPAKAEGAMLTLSHTDTDTVFKAQISASQSWVAAQREVILLGQSRGKVHFVARGKMDGPLFTVSVPKSRFPEGVVQWTLFDTKGEPLCERLTYNRSNHQFSIRLVPQKTVFKPREQVELEIQVTSPTGQPMATCLSLAVTDAGKVKYDEVGQENIQAYLLLSSEVKGVIEQPGYYFQSPVTKAVHESLDQLLITQGWRRFVWQKIAKGEMPQPKYFIEQSFGLGGTVTLPNGKPMSKGNLTLMVTNQDGLIANSQTDSLGRFFFGGLDYLDTIKTVVQARTDKDRKRLNIKINEPIFPVAPPRTFPFHSFQAEDYLANRRQQTLADLSFKDIADQVLREVEIKDSKIEDKVKEDGRFRIHGQADAVLMAKDNNFGAMAASGNILQALQGRVAGVQVTPDGTGGFNIQIRGPNSLSGGTAPLLLIDGVPMSDLSAANTINPNDVESIEVLKGTSAAIYGVQGANGVIAIYTRRGSDNLSSTLPREGIVNYVALGYYKAREFYSPDYTKTPPKTPKPDMRSTIYWNGQIKTDPLGRAKIVFHTADAPTRYRLVAEGLSLAGLPGATVQYLEIKKE